MNEDKFEQLVRDYPDIFEKAGPIEFSINDGWYNIINVLLLLLSHPLIQAKQRLKYRLENPELKGSKSVDELISIVDQEKENLPTLVQIKEKFGGLRFYMDGGTPEMHNYVSFAETMSSVTCESCGAPGKSRNDGWIRVLCDAHSSPR